jgi:hypothetical protein
MPLYFILRRKVYRSKIKLADTFKENLFHFICSQTSQELDSLPKRIPLEINFNKISVLPNYR